MLNEITKEGTHNIEDISKEQNDLIHKCSNCAYNASTSAVLKRYNKMKHKSLNNAQKMSCTDCGRSVTSEL